MTVSVNGRVISDAEIDREVQHHPAASLAEARGQAVQALVIRRLLLDEAARLGLDQSRAADAEDEDDPEEALIRSLLGQEIPVIEPDADSCREFFDGNRNLFRSPDMFQAAHILFAAEPDDPPARAAARAKAEEVIKELQSHPERFAQLAQTHSDCPSKARGGDLGQLTRGQTVPEFETFLYHVEPGALCSVPVPTPFGFHVLRVDQRAEGRLLEFDAIAGQVANFLRETTWRRAVRQYLAALAKAADIQGVELAQAGP